MDDFEKFVNDEITEAEFLERTSNLSPEEKAKLDAKIASEKSSELAAIKALRKEKNRLAELSKEKPPVDTGTKFREEQISKAMAKFKNEFEIDDKDLPIYQEEFKKLDEGHVDSELIFGNLKRIYAYKNPDQLLDARSKIKQFESNAEDFLETMAGANGSGSGEGADSKKYLPEAHAMVKQAKKNGETLTLEQAQSYLTKGLKRTY